MQRASSRVLCEFVERHKWSLILYVTNWTSHSTNTFFQVAARILLLKLTNNNLGQKQSYEHG